MPSKRQRKRGYRIPDNVRELATICISVEVPDHEYTRAAVRSQLDKLGLWGSWEKSYTVGDTRATEIAAYWRELMYTTYSEGNCEGASSMTRLRQDPNDPCILQYSNDEGLTWTDGFNYSLCNTGNGVDTRIDIVNQIVIEKEVNNYSTTVTNNYINNGRQTPIYDALTDEEKKNALCFFLGQLIDGTIDAFIDLKIAENEEYEKIPTFAALGLGIASALLAIPTGGGSLLALTATGTLLAGGALSAWLIFNDYDPGVLDDEELRDEAKCWLLEQWSYDIPSEAVFRGLDHTTAPSEIQDIIKVLESGFDSVDVYASILNAVNEASIVGGWYPACDCVETWSYQWDFTVSDGGFRVLSEDGKPFGQYVQGSGWHSVVGRGEHELYFTKDGLPSITPFEVEQRLEAITTFDPAIIAHQMRASGAELFGGPGTDMSNHRYRWAYEDITGDQIVFFSNNGNGGKVEYKCTSVTIRGNGPRPALTGGTFL